MNPGLKQSAKETEPTPAPSSRIAVMTRDVVPGKNTRRGGKDDGTIDPSKVGTR